MTNRTVHVEATISAIREPSGNGRIPYVVSLTEGGTTIPLVYWPEIQPELTAKIRVGNVIQVKAKVAAYRGRLELVISRAESVELVSAPPEASSSANSTPAPTTAPPTPTASAAPTPSPAPPPTPPSATSSTPAERTLIGKIKEDWVGRNVAILGTISGIDNGVKSRHLSVQDRTGEIEVVLDDQVLGGLEVNRLVPGRALTITGPVKLVDGKLVIVPEGASAVTMSP
ncbi:MAG TPA: OB-fold nucleic acid binding domain-containing protein [Verrucomicrobiae bacterium]|nr:OB-fold nucleic acid binding domain-containing protein [Verrucomicrobiae bacterium]